MKLFPRMFIRDKWLINTGHAKVGHGVTPSPNTLGYLALKERDCKGFIELEIIVRT